MAKLTNMLEEERKYDVTAQFRVPDLTPCLPAGGRLVPLPPVTLTATYFDTADLRLARAGASLRFRRDTSTIPAEGNPPADANDGGGSAYSGVADADGDSPGDAADASSPPAPSPAVRTIAEPASSAAASAASEPGPTTASPSVAPRAVPAAPSSPWTVKLPTGSPGVRHEISLPGAPETPPTALVALVTAVSRGAPLAPVTVIRTVRRAYELRDADDRVLAELADDSVSVLAGREVVRRFREIEVERKHGDRKLLRKADALLRDAGARGGDFTPKHVRALGDPAHRPPDLVPLPSGRPADSPAATTDSAKGKSKGGKHKGGTKAQAGEVVTAAIRRGVHRILDHDPLVRLRATVGDDDTAVHQMRVGCRRLRSDLRTFGPLLDPDWTGRLRRELSWLAGALGAARDAEVLRARLRQTAAADPLAELDGASVARIDAALAARHEKALSELDAALADERYLRLVEALVSAARKPRLTELARGRAHQVLPRLVAGPWRRFAYGSRGVDGAVDLRQDSPDERWHAVRIRGKRARYAVDAVCQTIGGEAIELSKALAAVQDLLGEHQDAAIAAQTWLSVAATDPDDHAFAVTAGRLFERERARSRDVRARFPQVWHAAAKRRLVAWLP